MSNVKLPRQRLAYKRKGEQWRKDNIDAIDKGYSMYYNGGLRLSLAEKVINQNLYEGVLDTSDMAKYLNPYGIQGYDIDKGLGHHSIIVPKIDVLVGEVANRQIDWEVFVTNPDAVSSKIKNKRADISKRLMDIIQAKYPEDNEQAKNAMEAEMAKLQKYANYSWKDLKELRANRILKYFSTKDNFKNIFAEGFKDALILGEEVYQTDIISGAPKLFKLNPMNVHTVRSGNSSKIEDSDIIIIDDHWSPGRIIDTFYEQLKPDEVSRIAGDDDTDNMESSDNVEDSFVLFESDVDKQTISGVQGAIEIAEINGHKFSPDYRDDTGNVRVLRVYWKSLRRIKKVKYYDEQANTQYKIMGEQYIPDKIRGEEVKDLWINEWWEGTKIGKDIYIQMRPVATQYTSVNQPAITSIPITGELYNTNQGKVVSLVTRMKSYQYLYDAIWDRLNKAISKNMGKILEVDVAKIPANWDVGKWMHYATTMGIGVVDSFKEGNKGKATGMLAGNFNTTGKVLDVETGSYIQHHIQMLEFIKQEMSEIAGISKQREGTISNRETVGGVERSVAQSSHITEWWYLKHDDVVQRTLVAFLEVAKIALKGNKVMMQNILDDRSIEMFEVDGDQFADADYDVLLTSNENTAAIRQQIQQLAQAAMQNQMVNFSDMLYIFNSKSINDIRRRIETAEAEKQQQASEQAKADQANQKVMQEQAQSALQFEQELKAKEIEIKMSELELSRLEKDRDYNLEVLKLQLSEEVDMSKIESELNKVDEELDHKKKELEELKRANKANESIKMIAAKKPASSSNNI